MLSLPRAEPARERLAVNLRHVTGFPSAKPPDMLDFGVAKRLAVNDAVVQIAAANEFFLDALDSFEVCTKLFR